MDELTRKYYEEYLEFENFIEFRRFDLEKKDEKGRSPMYSDYASNIQEVEEIISKYDNDRYIVYCGCNTREKRARVDGSIKFRRTFFFDIEMDGEKPQLTDKVYYNKLMKTSLYIWRAMELIGLKPNLLMESGRGLHIGIKVIPLSTETYDARFKTWYKSYIKTLMENRPFKEIKFDDSMVNASRIQSAPGFAHNKYPEKPRRKVLVCKTFQNNLLPFINRKKVYELRKQKYFPNHRKKYTNITFYKSPEWLLLSENDDLPEGDIHSKIILIIKILARDNNLDINKLQSKLLELGYNEVVDTPDPEIYTYNPWTIFNWAMKNAEYCVKRRIVLPFPFDAERYIVKEIDEDKSPEGKAFATIPISDFGGVMRYIRDFNKATAYREGEKFVIFQDLLWRKLKACIEDKYLLEYIEFLNLKDFISAEISTLDSDAL